jgi:hypothetical protein
LDIVVSSSGYAAPNGPAGYVTMVVELARKRKCRLTLDSIASRYWPSFNTPRLSNRLCNGISLSDEATLRCFQRPIGGRHLSFILRTPMTKLSKTLIAATAFAAIATSAFSQAPMEFKSGMAHVYVGGKMSGITIAPSEKNHEAMMKNATKVPNNTVFFMNNGQLYSTSGMLDPTGNFYLP